MSGSFFNSLDYFCILLTFASCLVGFLRGFIKDFFGTCSWVGGGFATALVSPYVAHRLQMNGTISNPTLAKIAAIVFSFTVVLITLLLLVHVLSKLIKATFFSGLDRAFGALYGFTRGFIILTVFCVGAMMFNLFDRKLKFISDSKVVPYLMVAVDHMMPKIIKVTEFKDKLSSVKSELEFSEEDISMMEAFIKGQAYRNEENQKSIIDDKQSHLRKVKDYFDGLISKIFRRDISSSVNRQPQKKQIRKIRNKDDNTEFGCMDLMKARAKRRAQKKAERLKKDVLKRLDGRP